MTASTIRLRRWLAGLALLLALPATSAVARGLRTAAGRRGLRPVRAGHRAGPHRGALADRRRLLPVPAPHLGQGRCRLHRRDHGAAEGQGLPRRILRRRRNLPQGIARHPHRHARGRRERDHPDREVPRAAPMPACATRRRPAP